MSLDEVIGKFISHQMMVKYAKYIDNVANGSTPSTEPQVVAFNATYEKEAHRRSTKFYNSALHLKY
jgi:uncharacterized protein YccT (UPF0319 family)